MLKAPNIYEEMNFPQILRPANLSNKCINLSSYI